MKIPASSSLLIATLAVSSSSSALAAPSGEGHQESSVKPSPSGSALVSSTSSESLGPKQSSLAERDITPDPIAERGLLDIPCSLVQTVTSIVPLPVIGDLLCSKGAKAGDEGSVDEDKVQAELSQLSNALTRVPLPLPTSALSPALGALNNASSAASGMIPGTPFNSSRVSEAGPPANTSAIAFSNSSDTYGSSSMASMSTTSLWRAQPTPANSPSLPIDSSPSQSPTSDPVSASSGGSSTTATV